MVLPVDVTNSLLPSFTFSLESLSALWSFPNLKKAAIRQTVRVVAEKKIVILNDGSLTIDAWELGSLYGYKLCLYVIIEPANLQEHVDVMQSLRFATKKKKKKKTTFLFFL